MSSPSSASFSPSVPITALRRVPDDLANFLENPGRARVFLAADKENPQGSEESAGTKLSVLQQHVKFFDSNDDGVITLSETYNGFRALGFGVALALVAMIFIHAFVSFPTQPSWLINPTFPIYIDNIHLGKHGSDSEVFDPEGRFIPEKFEEIFSKFAKENPQRLNWAELMKFLSAIRNAMDFMGMIAARFEWFFTWILLADREAGGSSFLTKEKIRRTLDGTIFYHIEKEQTEKNKQKK